MLKVYTNIAYLTEEHRGKIFPLLLGLHYKPLPLVSEYFELTDNVAEVDILILPLHIEFFLKNDKLVYHQFLELSKKFNKPLWIYSSGDFGTTLKDEVTTFRCGGFNTLYSPKKTYIMPSFISDPYQNSLKLRASKPLKKPIQPTLGFVGHADGSVLKWFKEMSIFLKYQTDCYLGQRVTDKQRFFPSSIRRYQILQLLEQVQQLQSDFKYREKYRAGATTELQRQNTTMEYFNNIYDNLYTLCMRGAGNFSVRFYETLAVGRIPVYIDTNGGLPLENTIDWDKHIVRIPWDKREKLSKLLLEFHHSKSGNELQSIQKANRNLWEQIGHIGGYFKAVQESLKQNVL